MANRSDPIFYKCPLCERHYYLEGVSWEEEFYPDEVVTARILRGDYIISNRCMDCFRRQETIIWYWREGKDSLSMRPVKEAAIKQGDRVWTGRRHGQIIQQMHSEGCPKVTAPMQGFITESGEFLSRSEAYERAILCGQIKECGDSGHMRELVSEELY